MNTQLAFPVALAAWVSLFSFISHEPLETGAATRPEIQEDLKITFGVWYRGANHLTLKGVSPSKSRDTIQFFKRQLSSAVRVYSIQHNRADFTPMNIVVKSFSKRKLVHTARPPYNPSTKKIEFSEDYVQPDEDFVQVIITFQGKPGEKVDYIINLNLVKNFP